MAESSHETVTSTTLGTYTLTLSADKAECNVGDIVVFSGNLKADAVNVPNAQIQLAWARLFLRFLLDIHSRGSEGLRSSVMGEKEDRTPLLHNFTSAFTPFSLLVYKRRL